MHRTLIIEARSHIQMSMTAVSTSAIQWVARAMGIEVKE